MANRQAAQAFLIEAIEEVLPGGGNKELYEALFAKMSDKEFEQLMTSYEKGEDRPVIYAPNFTDVNLNTERNINLAEKHGHSFFERIWFHSNDPDTPAHLSPNAYMVVEMPVRRQAQLLDKKISVVDHNRSMDQITGQASGDSKASKISLNELYVLRSMGMEKTLTEFIKYRGGDLGGMNAMNKTIGRQGSASIAAIEPYATGVESTHALKIYLTAMHLKNTL